MTSGKNKNLMIILAVGLIALLIIGSIFIYEPPLQRYEKRRDMMDTYVTIMVYDTDEDHAMKSIDSAFDRIEEVIAITSRYNSSSELYSLNEQGQLTDASPELVELIETSIHYYEITDGAFDITITPLLDLWSEEFKLTELDTDYRSDLEAGTFSESLRDEFEDLDPPLYELVETPTVSSSDHGWMVSSSWQMYYITDGDTSLSLSTNFWYLPYDTQGYYINQTQQYVGSDKIQIQGSSITLQEGMSLTLDGIAKGYAVDEAVEELRSNDIDSALVNAGGDIATLGEKPGGEKWVTGLRNPEDEEESVMEFELSGEAIATSGNYERYFDENAEVGHIMDPRTGRTVTKCSSATIIAGECTSADALATAIFVLGPEDGTNLVNSLDGTESLVLGYEDPSVMTESDGMSDHEMKEG
ncbi:MAG: FAD:protein FMN transferase [Thermoplasmata archaeon]